MGSLTSCETLQMEHNQTFKMVSVHERHATHGFNLPGSPSFRELSFSAAEDIFGVGLGLTHGLEYAKSFWGAAQKNAISEALYDRELKSYRDLYSYVLDRSNFASDKDYDKADHARFVLREMALPHVTNVTPELVGQDVFDAQYDISDPSQGWHLLFLLAGWFKRRRVSVYRKARSEDSSHVESFRLMTIRRAFSISMSFKNWTLPASFRFSLSRDEHLESGRRSPVKPQRHSVTFFEFIEGSCTARGWFTPSTKQDFDDIACCNPRVLEELTTYTPDGIVISGLPSTKWTVDDFVDICDTHDHGLLQLTNDGSPHARWGSFPHRVRFPFCISPEEFHANQRPWVGVNELPGTFIAALSCSVHSRKGEWTSSKAIQAEKQRRRGKGGATAQASKETVPEAPEQASAEKKRASKKREEFPAQRPNPGPQGLIR